MTPTRSPARAPEYFLHRTVAEAVDSAAPTDKRAGINCAELDTVHLQVVPSTSANPAVEVLFWSEEAGKFISQHTALSFAAKGAGLSWEASIQAKGRVIFPMVTTGVTTGDTVKILASRFGVE